MCGKGSAEVVRPAHFHPNGWVAPTRSGERRLEGQREAALPGDVVLRLVEPVAVELVDEVPTLGANADAPEAVLETHPVVAGELGPGAVRAQLVEADRAEAPEEIGAERAGAGAQRITQDDVGVVGELVELAAAGEAGAANAVLGPATAGADADVVVEPSRGIERRGPAEPPIGGSRPVHDGRARQAAKSAPPHPGGIKGTAAPRQPGGCPGGEPRGGERQRQRHGGPGERKPQP